MPCPEGKELSKCAQGTRSEHYCCKLARCSSIPKSSRMITADKVSGGEKVCSCDDGEEKAKCGELGTGQYHCCKQPLCDTLLIDQRAIGAPHHAVVDLRRGSPRVSTQKMRRKYPAETLVLQSTAMR